MFQIAMVEGVDVIVVRKVAGETQEEVLQVEVTTDGTFTDTQNPCDGLTSPLEPMDNTGGGFTDENGGSFREKATPGMAPWCFPTKYRYVTVSSVTSARRLHGWYVSGLQHTAPTRY